VKFYQLVANLHQCIFTHFRQFIFIFRKMVFFSRSTFYHFKFSVSSSQTAATSSIFTNDKCSPPVHPTSSHWIIM